MQRTLWTLLGSIAISAGVGNGSGAQGVGLQRTGTRTDTVDILAAVWRAASHGHSELRVPWLYLPSADPGAVAVSSNVRTDLATRGVPASLRKPTGDDTVVYRVRRFEGRSVDTATVQMESQWTEVLTSGARACRTGSGNSESYRVVRARRVWHATLSGRVMHGDKACVPVR